MFGLSFTHLILLAVIVLIFIGPEQLPEVARTLARLVNEWKRASSDLQSSLTNTIREDFSAKPTENPATPPQAADTNESGGEKKS
jgi:TatA/E family protein of Tat protein translocase